MIAQMRLLLRGRINMAAIFKNVAGTVIAIGTSDNESSPETGVLRIEGAGSV